MCLAVPGSIVSIGDRARATVDMMGARREVSLRLTPEAKPGDYVLVHAGFAIQVIDERQAAETIDILNDLAEIEGGELGSANTAGARA